MCIVMSMTLNAYQVIAGTYTDMSTINTYRTLEQADLHVSQLRADGWDAYVRTVWLAV